MEGTSGSRRIADSASLRRHPPRMNRSVIRSGRSRGAKRLAHPPLRTASAVGSRGLEFTSPDSASLSEAVDLFPPRRWLCNGPQTFDLSRGMSLVVPLWRERHGAILRTARELSSNAPPRFSELFIRAQTTSGSPEIALRPVSGIARQIACYVCREKLRACCLTTAHSSHRTRRAMSYDTTVNDAIDPPEARLPARRQRAARWWKWAAALSLAMVVAVLCGAWIWWR